MSNQNSRSLTEARVLELINQRVRLFQRRTFDDLPPVIVPADSVGNNELNAGAPTNGYVLTADDGEGSGIKWDELPAFVVPANSVGNTELDAGSPTDGHVLTADSGEASGVKWAAAAGGGSSLIPIDVQTFTANGTWNKPANLVYAVVDVIGGGGGGGGSGTAGASGGGGAGGGLSRKFLLDSALDSTESVTVGDGGGGGSAGNNPGSAGGTSLFGLHCSATGGAGGTEGNASPASPATGGVGLGGDINLAGENAVERIGNSTGTIGGGSSPLGYGYGANSALNGSANLNALAGSGYGGGGSGGRAESANRSGGDGAPGVVIVISYGTV